MSCRLDSVTLVRDTVVELKERSESSVCDQATCLCMSLSLCISPVACLYVLFGILPGGFHAVCLSSQLCLFARVCPVSLTCHLHVTQALLSFAFKPCGKLIAYKCKCCFTVLSMLIFWFKLKASIKGTMQSFCEVLWHWGTARLVGGGCCLQDADSTRSFVTWTLKMVNPSGVENVWCKIRRGVLEKMNANIFACMQTCVTAGVCVWHNPSWRSFEEQSLQNPMASSPHSNYTLVFLVPCCAVPSQECAILSPNSSSHSYQGTVAFINQACPHQHLHTQFKTGI